MIDDITAAEPLARWLGVARVVADEFAITARERDLGRTRAEHEIGRLKKSGLLALSVPRDFGGAGISSAMRDGDPAMTVSTPATSPQATEVSS
jgi:alkylation response protein AidB-like acyl-CoA dehydrogenase